MSDRKVKVTIEIDLDTGEYSMVFNNVSHPGRSIDFTETAKYLKAVFAKNEKQVNADAETGGSGQAKRDKEEFN